MPNRVVTEDLGRGVMRVTLNDPSTKNCVDASHCAELSAAFDKLQADQSVKVLIFAGAREVFCGGGTLDTVQKFVAGTVEPVVPLLLVKLLSFPLPVIAALE